MIAVRRGAADTLQFVVAASVLLFWLQALRVMFAVMFGIVYDQTRSGPIGPWLFVSSLLVVTSLIAPALLVPSAKWIRSNRGSLVSFTIAVALGRLVVSVDEPSVRYWGSLLAVSAGVAYLSALIRFERRIALPALVAALVVDQCLRAAGDTYDLSLRSSWIPVQAVWSLLLALTSVRVARSTDPRGNGGGEALGLASGGALGGVLFLETSLLSLPNAVSRWSDQPLAVITPALAGITVLPLFPAVHRRILACLSLALLTRLAIGSFLGTMLVAGYFVGGFLSAAALLAAQAASLALLVCSLDGSPRHPVRSPAPGLAVGLLLLILLGLLNTFTFTYAYTLPFMRGLGWAVYLAGALLAAAVVLHRRPAPPDSSWLVPGTAWVSLGGAVAVAISIATVWPQSASPMPDTGRLRIATYNIHYGYDESWRFRLDEMARTIEDNDVDVIALQEVDAGRLTSYGVDDAYYLARRLEMNVTFLPTIEHLTGIALLYRGSSLASADRLLTSKREQTGIVYAQLPVDGKSLHAYGTWLGLSGENTPAQIGEALDFVGDLTPAIYAGDFNAQPGSQVVRAIEAAGFVDPFVALGVDPAPLTSPATRPGKRIDYVWLRGLTPTGAWVAESTASDHRIVIVEVQQLP